jgi:hypothetical protein
MTTIEDLRVQLADVLDLSEVESLHDRIQLFRWVIDITAELNAFRSELEASIAADMEDDQIGTPFGTLVRRQGGKRRNWDGRRLAFVVAAGKEKPEEVVEALIQAAALDRPSHGWRAGELKKMGIQPGAFSEYEPGRITVSFA